MKEKLLEANVLLDKWAKPALTRMVLRRTTNGEHRTMIKKDYGIKRGVVEELTAFPLGTYCILERTDVANLAQKTLYKRRIEGVSCMRSQACYGDGSG